VSRRAPLDREELAACIILLGSIPVSVALLGLLFEAFSGLGGFALIAPFVPPFVAALTIGERAFPAELTRGVVSATLVATFCTLAAFFVGQVLLAAPGSDVAGIAGVAGLAVYVAGAVMVVRDRLHDERLWPAVGAISAGVFWLLSAVLHQV
jgi:hypothetical protein